MARKGADVKSFSRRVADWIDNHPRTGWYIAVWAILVTLNTFVGVIDIVLGH